MSASPQQPAPVGGQSPVPAGSEAGTKPEQMKGDPRTQEEIDEDNAMADRLAQIIEDANERVVPLCDMIRKVTRCFREYSTTVSNGPLVAH